MDFIGRKNELKTLSGLKKKKSASLVCILGRRRIGKSALIEKWGEEFQNFFEVQGLGPDIKHTDIDQLNHFAQEIALRFKIPRPELSNWDIAFDYLAQLTSKGSWLIFLDEISWLGGKDPLFPVKLKSAWDIKFKKNAKLILVLCGSVSSWIEDNILNSAHFLGRVSLSLNLQELSLSEVYEFWKANHFHIGTLEMMTILSITGGVPKYLEEIPRDEPTTKTLARLCLNPSGILYSDFPKIFNEIFRKRSIKLEKIMRLCLDEKLTPAQLAKKLKVDHDSDLTQAIHILELSGFISRDYYFKPQTNEVGKLSHLRVKDNYSRFYLKVIEPLQAKIKAGATQIRDLQQLKSWTSILGAQFENIILANRESVHRVLGIFPEQILSSAPYIQRKTTLTPRACQIDLLINTDLDVFYLCELKCKRWITSEVIAEVEKKVKSIKIPRRSSLKPVLIYEGELHPSNEEKIRDYFYRVINLGDLIQATQGPSHPESPLPQD